MKKETTEKRHIAEIVSRHAMAYPQVRFILEQDGREVFRLTAAAALADVIVSAMGLMQQEHARSGRHAGGTFASTVSPPRRA
ncbi:MAG: hypothetical protein U0521_23555 [Anaerolineae bacterium]